MRVVASGRGNHILCQQILLERVPTVRQRRVSHTYTFMHSAAGACHLVVGELQRFDTHIGKERRCAGAFPCKVSSVTGVTFQVFVLEG